ncbi:MAG: hypothetical protein N3D72_02345 [Candidatus Methanomethyliaceae archaeon]|nr:hypothetical protein [Candidatus Methanomethyliaceae archaeon]
MKLLQVLKNKRGDISSPIIVILVTVAALAVAGMTVAWMASTGARVANQGSLIVLGTPTLTSGLNPTLLMTVKNIGTAQVNISAVRISTYSASINQNVAPGSSLIISVIINNFTSQSGQTYNGTLLTDAGTIAFLAYCQ